MNINIDNNKLCFDINEELIGKNITNNTIGVKNGIIELDYEKYSYLLAFSSIRCLCYDDYMGGFEFGVSYNCK